MGEGEDALGREPPAVLVHGGEGGDHLVHELDLVVADVTDSVVVGDGVQELPQEWRPVVGIAGQQLVQQRGAGAAEPGDDDRRLDRLAQDRRLLLPEVDHAQPVLQDQLELAAGTQPAGQVEARFAVEGGAKPGEGLLPPGVAEVVETRRGGGGGAEVLGLAARSGSVRRRRGPARA